MATIKNRELFSPVGISLMALSLEGLACLLWLLTIPGDPKNAVLFGLSGTRLALAGLLLLLTAIAARAVLHTKLRNQAQQFLDRFSDSRQMFGGVLGLFSLALWLFSSRRFLGFANEAALTRLEPVLLYFVLALGHLLALLLLTDPKGERRKAWPAVLAMALLAIYLSGTLHYAGLNDRVERSDQSGFVEFAREVRLSGFNYTGTRNFMPGYAFLQAAILDPIKSTDQLFAEGKLLNIGLSLLAIGAVFLIGRRHLSKRNAYLFILLAAFTIFIYKAPHYQPEVVFYLLFFTSFYLMARLLVRPDWRLAITLGLVAGLAQLTKASMLPAVGLFSVLYALLALTRLVNRQQAKYYALSLVLFLGVFLGTLFPYIRESKAVYGQYFYNVNTTFYAWYDSWREAKAGTRAHGDGTGWPDLSPDEIPSPTKYLREHSTAQIAERLGRGSLHQLDNLWKPFSSISYPLLGLLLVGAASVLSWPRAKNLLRAYKGLAAFAALFGLGYLTLFAWYAPIADYSDMRFMYALHLPILFAALAALERLLEPEAMYRIGPIGASGAKWMQGAQITLAALLVYELLFWLPAHLSIHNWYGK